MPDIFQPRKNYRPYEYDSLTTPFINAMWASHWSHNEFNFTSDKQEYLTELTPQEQQVVRRSALLISQIEVAVKSFWGNLGKALPKPEFEELGAVFAGVEVIHLRAYSKIISMLGLEKEFEDMLNEEVISNRTTYLNKYKSGDFDNDKKKFLYSIILYTLFTEGSSLFSQFYILLGFNRFRGIMKDIANIVQYTSTEEQNHMQGGIGIINQIKEEYPELFDEGLVKRVQEEVVVAFESESKLVDWILGGYENKFLSEYILKNYIKYRLNSALEKIGIESPLTVDNNVKEKFFWMEEEILAPGNIDFFFKKPVSYSKASKSFSEEELF